MMQKTDICEHAIEGLRKSCVKTVHIVGRRGPLQVRYAIVEPLLLATSLQRPLFWGGQFIHWLSFKPLNDGHLSTMATFLGRKVHTLALVETPQQYGHLSIMATAAKLCPQLPK